MGYDIKSVLKKWAIHGRKQIYSYWGLYLLFFLAISVAIITIVVGDNLYATINDNLDSNVVWIKMAKDWGEYGSDDANIPFLGGQSGLKVGYNIRSLIFYIFPVTVAYYITFIMKIVLSGLGFWLFANKINKYSHYGVDQNVFCACGTVYGFLGSWPSAAVGFALLPWMVLLIYLLYTTKKLIYMLLPILFVKDVGLPLLGIFVLFYYFLFCVVVYVRDRRFHKQICLGFISLAFVYYFLNYGMIHSVLRSSQATIKSLAKMNYDDSILESIGQFTDKFLMKGLYHCGGADLRFFVIPICTAFFFVHIIRIVRGNKKKESFLYIGIFTAIVLNTLFCCFDYNHIFRKIIFFASGFQFSRFAWLSPYMWLILFAFACSEFKHIFLQGACIIVALLLLIFIPVYAEANSMYNEVYSNVYAWLSGSPLGLKNNEWTWKEYYSENLFDHIKEDIGYDGSWSVAYGVECAALQYNGIKTLDGYYSNYLLDYHEVFQRMIQSELDLDEEHQDYWNRSYGIRAYLYSPYWDYYMSKESKLEEANLYIDSDIFFKELNGRYIFSRVKISNSEGLGFDFIGQWSDDESPYTIYLYEVTEDSWQRTERAREVWRRQSEINKYIYKNVFISYDRHDLFGNEDTYYEDDEIVVLNEGGVFGPYATLEPGEYEVAYLGENMDACDYGVSSESNQEAIQFQEISKSINEILVRLTVLDEVNDVEFKVVNNSNKEVRVDKVITFKTDLDDLDYSLGWKEINAYQAGRALYDAGILESFSNDRLYCNEMVQKTGIGFELSPGGVVFGPYTRIEPGIYLLRFKGLNLRKCDFDIFSGIGFNQENYDYKIIERSSDETIIWLEVNKKINKVEFRSFNHSNENISLEEVDLIKIDTIIDKEQYAGYPTEKKSDHHQLEEDIHSVFATLDQYEGVMRVA